MNHHSNQLEQAGAEARTQSEAACALPAHRGAVDVAGALPSNTAPDNCIDRSSAVIRAGIDSLYLSFTGEMLEEMGSLLEALKHLAQSEDLGEQAKAVLRIHDSEFQVLPRGRGYYPFVLKDGMFDIQVSSDSSTKLPLAYVQISSRALTESGPRPVVEYLISIVQQIGFIREIKVSRVDVCCDFVTDVAFALLPPEAWVSRSRKQAARRENGEFTGLVFGEGSPLSARLYDKTLEIRKSRKFYLEELWWLEGWDRQTQVWRIEFQLQRKPLTELGLSSFEDVVAQIEPLWAYATGDWLRLAIPGKDQTRSRWPSHPLWMVLQSAAFDSENVLPLSRSQKESVPDDLYLFQTGLHPIISYMAARGISTFAEGGPAYLKAVNEFHAFRSLETGQNLEDYCSKRVKLRAWKYGKPSHRPLGGANE